MLRRQRKAAEADRAGLCESAAVVEIEWLIGDRGARPFGEFGGVRRRRGTCHDEEFLAAPAHEVIAVAEDGTEPAGHLLQYGVAGRVAEVVVDLLEMVEVEKEEHQPGIVAQAGAIVQVALISAHRQGEIGLDVLRQEAAIAQAGQRIGQTRLGKRRRLALQGQRQSLEIGRALAHCARARCA